MFEVHGKSTHSGASWPGLGVAPRTPTYWLTASVRQLAEALQHVIAKHSMAMHRTARFTQHFDHPCTNSQTAEHSQANVRMCGNKIQVLQCPVV